MRNDCCNTHSHPYFKHHRYYGRRFLTEEEKQEIYKRQKDMKIKWMTQYKESLENELKGVTERLTELRKEAD
jgi:hypothetical protein